MTKAEEKACHIFNMIARGRWVGGMEITRYEMQNLASKTITNIEEEVARREAEEDSGVS